MVCIWDLNCEFQIVPTQDGQSRTVHPLIEILAQSGLCSSLAWCPVDTNYICTGIYNIIYIHVYVQVEDIVCVCVCVCVCV